MPYTPHSPARFHEPAPQRQVFRGTQTSLGAHYIREAGILAPFVIGELVEDPGKQWRWIKLASLITAVLSQGMWTAKIHAERKAPREHNTYHHHPG